MTEYRLACAKELCRNIRDDATVEVAYGRIKYVAGAKGTAKLILAVLNSPGEDAEGEGQEVSGKTEQLGATASKLLSRDFVTLGHKLKAAKGLWAAGQVLGEIEQLLDEAKHFVALGRRGEQLIADSEK